MSVINGHVIIVIVSSPNVITFKAFNIHKQLEIPMDFSGHSKSKFIIVLGSLF